MVLFTEREIQERVKSLAIQVSYQANPESQPRVMIGVLNGAFMFFADLVRNMEVDCEIDFINAKSYEGRMQTPYGEVKIIDSLKVDIEGKDVYLVDDIYDSGNTINKLTEHLTAYNPRSITPVTLFKRHTSNRADLIYGFELHNEAWLVGYGLDGTGGFKRNKPYITGVLNDE